ncbi:MAG: glycine/D-amino acid oxidase-like deaminating enzyme [Paracoccaceae bacterium]|jgi:glycine/D-amino acid oxidase-like deaminating enzyme
MKRLYEDLVYDTSTSIRSWWQASGVEPLQYPRIEGDHKTEVAIIGGGFTGLNAALQLAEEHGTESTILEAAQPGWGASGRNGGFACLGGTVMSSSAQVKKFGLEAAKAFAHAQVAAIDRVADNMARYEIDADTHSDGDLYLAHRASKLKGMLEEAEFDKREFGLDFQSLSKSDLASIGAESPEFHGGVKTKIGFALNPLKYVTGLTKAAANAGVKISGDSPVTSVKMQGGEFVLTTPTATIRAKRVIVATNGYSSDDIPPALDGRFLPILSTIMVTRPITDAEQAAQGWHSDLMTYDSRHLLHYFRLMPDGRFLFGQRGAVRATPNATIAAQVANRRDFERMFPAWRHIETSHKWFGLICMTRNLHQFAGPIPGMPGAFAALGYHGSGVAMASFSGRALADMALGKSHGLPSIMTRPLKRFPFAGFRRVGVQTAYVKYQLQDRFF